MRRPALPYELLASFARARAERAKDLSSGTRRLVMQVSTTDPRDPTQVPDGMKDDVGKSNPAPSDFNDDGEDDDLVDDDDMMRDDDED